MSKKTLEEIKENFKTVKTVRCLSSGNKYPIDIKRMKIDPSMYWCRDVLNLFDVALFNKETNEYAEIIEYKNEVNKLKEDLRLLLIAYKLCYLTDFISKQAEELYLSEKPTLDKYDLEVILKKYEGWGFDYVDSEIRLKTEKLINII